MHLCVTLTWEVFFRMLAAASGNAEVEIKVQHNMGRTCRVAGNDKLKLQHVALRFLRMRW